MAGAEGWAFGAEARGGFYFAVFEDGLQVFQGDCAEARVLGFSAGGWGAGILVPVVAGVGLVFPRLPGGLLGFLHIKPF